MPASPGTTPECLFAAWLLDHDAGQSTGLDSLCREHPQHAARLRELHREWDDLRGILTQIGLSGSLVQRIEARFGGDVDPRVTLEPEGAGPGDVSAEVLARLAGRGPTSTRYRIQGEVAHGGMGAVLRVWDEDLRRHLAMKVILGKGEPGGTPQVDPGLLARFLEEAQVTGQLDHPGIVPVHELGLDADGRVYFTMKLVKGRTLEEVFGELARDEGDWTQTRVLGLLLRVCEAMSYAHDKGVVHRDLKPANVMVGGFGEVYVMDWGLARVLDAPPSTAKTTASVVQSLRRRRSDSSSGSSLETLEGDILGTPAYMSPEQSRGHPDEIGPPSDVYSLGAMLYRLLAGRAPPSPLDLRDEGEVPPLHEVAPATPVELEAICERAMAFDPDARYPDMSALADDLSAYLEGRVVSAYETGPWAEARKWVRRNLPLAAALTTALVLLLIGLVSSLMLKAQSDANAERADAKAQEAEDNLVLAQRSQAAAEAETAKVLRLADAKRVQQLVEEADTLWPPYPALISELESWVERARALVDNAPLHRTTLDEMRRLAASSPSETLEQQWQHDLLAELVGDLEALEIGLLAPDAVPPGSGWSVPKRLAFARALDAGLAPGGEHARAWADAASGLREAYPGLDLRPQIGLVPLGPDPATGLWEFAHLLTGEPAQRDPEGSLVLEEATGVVLVLLPGASFWMGAQAGDPTGRNYDPQSTDRDEGPVHEVELSPFFLSKYEITQGQWERVTGRNPSALSRSRLAPTLLHPVEQVSWLECAKWLPRAGLALPSEAQWEFAARGGTHTPWWTGAERDTLKELRAANLADQAAARMGAPWAGVADWPELDDGFAVHAPVGTFAANPFGLHDVTGNVWEWCRDAYAWDFYAVSPRLDPVAPAGPEPVYVVRGGSYGAMATQARSSARDADAPTGLDASLGVRPARALDP